MDVRKIGLFECCMFINLHYLRLEQENRQIC